MATLPFTIDSHLLQELGERLVGRPHIALAELVKNAYDADANHCEIVFSENEIEVWDDGHGMTFDEFRDFWMRIGTTNKLEQRVSKAYGRALTGSKGIGRLAVQFLGRQVRIITTSDESDSRCVTASVDWDKAIEAGELTKAVAEYRLSRSRERYASGSQTGTKIVLQTLNHDWTDSDDGESPAQALARQVWMLQPPFADSVREGDQGPENFRIDFVSFDAAMENAFRTQLAGVLDVWDARIEGELRNGRSVGRCDLVVSFRDGDAYEVAIPLKKGLIDRCDFEIRIFKLYGKQPGKISVGQARDYFREFGSVHVYDGGFRLPYYGIDHDWLRIESDHSHRRSVSQLLPNELNVPLAMHDLPTTERIFGAVQINTTRELRSASPVDRDRGRFLKINIGRDRLVDNQAYQELVRVVRWSIDYYTTRYQLRQERQVAQMRPTEPPIPKLKRLRQTIDEISAEVAPPLHRRLVREVDDYYESVQREGKYAERQTALLAPLAAAGLASLAFEHENNRQARRLKSLVRRLSRLDDRKGQTDSVDELAAEFQEWMEQQQRTRSLFSPLMTEQDREDVRRLRAKPTTRVVLRNTRPLLRSLEASLDGIDSAYDYDPVWEKCRELHVSPTFHRGSRGRAFRMSPSNFCYNHIGHFAAASEAVCKAIFLGGVTRRFPELNFAFLEGGVGFACLLYADLIGHWNIRNRDALEDVNPANLDPDLLLSLAERYAPAEMVKAIRAGNGISTNSSARTTGGIDELDDYAACGIGTAEDFTTLFVEPFYFGCEADDSSNAWAFNRACNPNRAEIKTLFGSDIGHFDVQDMSEVLTEAYELVEDERIDADGFRRFVFENPVHFWGKTNPAFFDGTRVAKEARTLLAA